MFLQFPIELEHCKPHIAARHHTKCDVINDVKLSLTVQLRMNCCKFSMLSNQTTRYKSYIDGYDYQNKEKDKTKKRIKQASRKIYLYNQADMSGLRDHVPV